MGLLAKIFGLLSKPGDKMSAEVTKTGRKVMKIHTSEGKHSVTQYKNGTTVETIVTRKKEIITKRWPHGQRLLILLYRAYLHIIPLILRMPHREGLSREGAVLLDAWEQIRLVHIRQQEADGIRHGRKALHGLGAMDVVDLAGIRRKVRIKRILQTADC